MSKIKIIDGNPHILFEQKIEVSNIEKGAGDFFKLMDSRRSVRDFSDKPVPKSVIENIIKTASTAPSGAHKQPWTFCVVESAEMKSQIRVAAEEEEKKSYDGRMSEEWLKAIFRNSSLPDYCIQKAI
jgi:iodotyrosine deiodinase